MSSASGAVGGGGQPRRREGKRPGVKPAHEQQARHRQNQPPALSRERGQGGGQPTRRRKVDPAPEPATGITDNPTQRENEEAARSTQRGEQQRLFKRKGRAFLVGEVSDKNGRTRSQRLARRRNKSKPKKVETPKARAPRTTRSGVPVMRAQPIIGG